MILLRNVPFAKMAQFLHDNVCEAPLPEDVVDARDR
jgi:hypothetical protein